MSQPARWTQGSPYSGGKGGGGECIHRKIKDKEKRRIKDKQASEGQRRGKKAYKDFYEISEEGCNGHSSGSQETP